MLIVRARAGRRSCCVQGQASEDSVGDKSLLQDLGIFFHLSRGRLDASPIILDSSFCIPKRTPGLTGRFHITRAFMHLSRRILLCATVLFMLSFTNAQQQVIECLRPHKMGDGPRPVYETGESVQFQWKSTWPNFNLTIVQTDSETQDKTRQQTFSTRWLA